VYLAKITIKNFRIFTDFELSFNEGLNLIVGENNSGKTALIDAIRYTLDTNAAEWIRVNERDFHKDTSQFSIQLKFEGITPNQASVFVEHLTHEPTGEGDKRKSVLYVNFEATLTDKTYRGYRFIQTDIRSGQDADGPRIEREIRNYLSTTYLKPLRDAEAELAAGRGSRLSQILYKSDELANNPDNIIALIEALLDANKRITNNEGVEKNLENIKKLLNKLKFDTDKFEPAIDIVGNKNIDDMSEHERKQTFKAILEKLSLSLDRDNPLQGLGYNNLLFMATELLLLEQEKDAFPLLLIEEPEAHLHPQLQMKLLKFIREVFSQEENPKLQSILTTHSPNFASKAPLDSLIIMVEGKAFPLRKGETELDDDDYEFLEKFLDVTKSNLFFAKAVLMVEGDGENILLPTIAELLGRPLENYGVSVVNIGNTAFSRYAKIFRRKGLDDVEHKNEWLPIKVACLLDLDLWPEKAEDKPENEPFGFKNKKRPDGKGRGGNLYCWLSEYSTDELEEKKNEKKSIRGQNVEAYLSDDWTFEFTLALKGLATEVYQAANGSSANFEHLPKDDEEMAIYIYKIIEEKKVKTNTAYTLVKILTEKYKEQEQQNVLKSKLPNYIIEAIEYVTEPLESIPLEATENQEETTGDA
jgi:putative ATP-dependent endonuclease of OLD family